MAYRRSYGGYGRRSYSRYSRPAPRYGRRRSYGGARGYMRGSGQARRYRPAARRFYYGGRTF